MKKGFTLIELMIVVAIVAFLAMVAVPSFSQFLAKAKRAEAYVNLHSMYAAQKAYWMEHGRYCDVLSGEGGLGWKPEGYHGGGSGEKFYYTYGCSAGGEGRNCFTGKLGTAASHLSKGYANDQGFMMIAAGDIMGNGYPDVLAIDQYNNITVLQDGLSR